jgi:thiamine biosynthesis lipoprotein
MDAVEIDGIRVRSKNRAVRVDFDQLVQGYAVDRELALLRERGIPHARLRVGQVTGALGSDGPGGWWLALPASFAKRGLPDRLALHDGERACLLTPEQGFSYQQHQYHRHLDARTGWPAAGIDSVIVIHARGDTAAVACAALLVAGPRDWPAVAARLGVREVLLQTGP